MILNDLINRLFKTSKVISYAAIVDRINLVYGPSRINFTGNPSIYCVCQSGTYAVDMHSIFEVTQEDFDKWFTLQKATRREQGENFSSLVLEPTSFLLQQSFFRKATGAELFNLTR